MQRDKLSETIEALKKGQIIVYPTDTLYALGADIYNESSVRKIFKIKKRSFENPLPIAVSALSDIERIAFLDDNAKRLAEHFLPGSLTLVLYKKNTIPNIVTSGSDKVAVRIPNNNIALELLTNFGPITVTSANLHGIETPINIIDIRRQLGEEVSIYLDNGILQGNPSTIVDVTSKKPKILREGTIAKKDILAVI